MLHVGNLEQNMNKAFKEIRPEQISSGSDIGKKRKNNEDIAYAGLSQYGLLLYICDGMGGHRKGEVASKIISDILSLSFSRNRHVFKPKIARKFALKCLNRANGEIYKHAIAGGEDYKDMGSTAVVAIVCEEETYIVSIGDSRCYTYSKHEGLVQRTIDQTYVEFLYEMGKITRSEMETHPQKNLLINVVGINSELSNVQDSVIPNDSYDVIMLCSDGLYNMVKADVIKSVLADESLTPAQMTKILIDKALENGGSDNIAVSIFKK
jgi:protein phosphatase